MSKHPGRQMMKRPQEDEGQKGKSSPEQEVAPCKGFL